MYHTPSDGSQIISIRMRGFPAPPPDLEAVQPETANIQNHIAFCPTWQIVRFVRVVVFRQSDHVRQFMFGSGRADWNHGHDFASVGQSGRYDNNRPNLTHFRRLKTGEVADKNLSRTRKKLNCHITQRAVHLSQPRPPSRPS